MMHNAKIAGAVIVILHLVGLAGMLSEDWNQLFLQLTPLNLIITGALVVAYQERHTQRFFLVCGLVFLIGFGIEVLGVHTGFPFGDYTYGKTLGPVLFEVPLLIGLNWLILILCSASVFNFVNNDLLAAVAGAATMVAIDLLIEPVAVTNDYWSWTSGNIPAANYISWFFVSFLLHLLIRSAGIERKNRLAYYVLVSQAIFFLTINILQN